MSGKAQQSKRRRVGREELLVAAREVAAEEGWEAVTVRKIAGRVGYQAPVIYEHFSSKDVLLLELSRLGFATLLDALRAARSSTGDPESILYALARAYLRFAWESPDLYQVMYGLGGSSFVAETWEEGQQIGDEVALAVRAVLRAYDREGVNPEGKVLALWAAMHGLVALMMAGRIVGGEAQAVRLAEQTVRDLLLAWRTD